MLIAFRLVDFLDGQRMMPLGTIPQISQASTSEELRHIDDMGSAAGGDKKTKINTLPFMKMAKNQDPRKLDIQEWSNFSNLKTIEGKKW